MDTPDNTQDPASGGTPAGDPRPAGDARPSEETVARRGRRGPSRGHRGPGRGRRGQAEVAADRAESAFAQAPGTAASDGDQVLLRLVDIGKSFGPVRVLNHITLDIPVGQVTAVVGDNGAGKSTLIKTISGIYQPDGGEIRWQGRQVHLHTPKDASDLGIATVYQDLALADNLDIVQNMFLGREPVKHFAAGRDRHGENRQADAGRPVGGHGPLGPPAGGLAVRRAAPGGRGRPGRDAPGEARDPGRADGGPGRHPDRASCST